MSMRASFSAPANPAADGARPSARCARLLLAAKAVFDAADDALYLALELFSLAFTLELFVAGGLARDLFDLALCLIGRAFDTILVHHRGLRDCAPYQAWFLQKGSTFVSNVKRCSAEITIPHSPKPEGRRKMPPPGRRARGPRRGCGCRSGNIAAHRATPVFDEG